MNALLQCPDAPPRCFNRDPLPAETRRFGLDSRTGEVIEVVLSNGWFVDRCAIHDGRGIGLWTNPGDVVLSPFMGIGSEGYVALEMGRRFVGVELKASYYQQAARNLEAALSQSPLFEVA